MRYRAFERLRTFFAVAIAENRGEDCARMQAGLNCCIEYRKRKRMSRRWRHGDGGD